MGRVGKESNMVRLFFMKINDTNKLLSSSIFLEIKNKNSFLKNYTGKVNKMILLCFLSVKEENYKESDYLSIILTIEELGSTASETHHSAEAISPLHRMETLASSEFIWCGKFFINCGCNHQTFPKKLSKNQDDLRFAPVS